MTYIYIGTTETVNNFIVIGTHPKSPINSLTELRNETGIEDLELLYQAIFTGNWGSNHPNSNIMSSMEYEMRSLISSDGFYSEYLKKYQSRLNKNLFKISKDKAIDLISSKYFKERQDFYKGKKIVKAQIDELNKEKNDKELVYKEVAKIFKTKLLELDEVWGVEVINKVKIIKKYEKENNPYYKGKIINFFNSVDFSSKLSWKISGLWDSLISKQDNTFTYTCLGKQSILLDSTIIDILGSYQVDAPKGSPMSYENRMLKREVIEQCNKKLTYKVSYTDYRDEYSFTSDCPSCKCSVKFSLKEKLKLKYFLINVNDFHHILYHSLPKHN